MTLVNILYSGLGGLSSVVFSLIEADEKKEYDHVIIFYGIEDMPQSYINKCKKLGVRFYFVKKKRGMDLSAHQRVIECLKESKPDMILLHSLSLILPVYSYCSRNKSSLISVEHQPNHQKTKKEWIWSVILMLFSHKVVYLTDLYKTQMKKYLGPVFIDKKVSVINNGINIYLFSPEPSQESPSPLIGMLARLSETKDHFTLIAAFKILVERNSYPGIKLCIAGEGDMKQKLIRQVEELHLLSSVEFMGMIPEALCPDYLNALTVYVHSSLGETMSTSLMQAMGCGKSIIASDVKGINNMISHNKTGILVESQNAIKLADEIDALLKDQSRRQLLGDNARQYAIDHYSNQRMFKSYQQLFYKS